VQRTLSVAVRAMGGPSACVHGHMADSVAAADAIKRHLRSSGATRWCREQRSVKPSAQPTLVRTQHLPHPGETARTLRKRGQRAVPACHTTYQGMSPWVDARQWLRTLADSVRAERAVRITARFADPCPFVLLPSIGPAGFGFPACAGGWQILLILAASCWIGPRHPVGRAVAAPVTRRAAAAGNGRPARCRSADEACRGGGFVLDRHLQPGAYSRDRACLASRAGLSRCRTAVCCRSRCLTSRSGRPDDRAGSWGQRRIGAVAVVTGPAGVLPSAVDRQAHISWSRYVSDRAFGFLCTGEREGRCPVSGFRDYQSVIQAGVRRGDATRRVPLDPEEVRALFGRMVGQVWTPAEIDILDRAAFSAML
jgi:hypothetical protein